LLQILFQISKVYDQCPEEDEMSLLNKNNKNDADDNDYDKKLLKLCMRYVIIIVIIVITIWWDCSFFYNGYISINYEIRQEQQQQEQKQG
jgi:hypothetical protein